MTHYTTTHTQQAQISTSNIVTNQHVASIQEFLGQLNDIQLGGTHDCDFRAISSDMVPIQRHDWSPKHIITQYYISRYEDEDDGVYEVIDEYDIELVESPNWEDTLYQICQDLHISSHYEDLVVLLEIFVAEGLEGVWQASPKTVLYSDDDNEDEDDAQSHDLASKWQDMLFCVGHEYYVLHLGVLE